MSGSAEFWLTPHTIGENPALPNPPGGCAAHRQFPGKLAAPGTARAILAEIERCAPALHRALAPVRARPRGRGAVAALDAAYRRAPSLSIDVAVLEKSRHVWTLPVDFHWSDVGTWSSLAEELGVDASASRVIEGEVVLESAKGNLVWGGRDRLVALLGVEGLAVIDSDDALLVARLDRSPELRRVVAALRRRGRSDLT